MYSEIYEDISLRTGGDIYIGVVGPVRTGKSTFIKKFMELLVIPNIENKYRKDRAIDELPQSGSGKSIMTCEPKFVPNEAIEINIIDGAPIHVRLVDSVGYLVNGAIGAYEGDVPRMVQTPWAEVAIPFEQAAEIGTRKVIENHSTIGIVVTTDGSIADIERREYVNAEERVVTKLKELNKPFVIILNSANPKSIETENLRDELEEKYSTSVIVMDVLNMDTDDLNKIFTKVLYEFPVSEVTYKIPKWVSNLSEEHWLMSQIEDYVFSSCGKNNCVRSIVSGIDSNVCENFDIAIDFMDLSCGNVVCDVKIENDVFYKIISDENDVSINNESDMFSVLTALLKNKKSVEAFNTAKNEAAMGGYGIVYPDMNSLEITEPEMFNDSGRFGISIKAKAKAMHIIQSDITSEISPVIGSESECEKFYDSLMDMYENKPQEFWDTEIFGRKLIDMMSDNIKLKLNTINEDTKQRMVKVTNKIANSQKGGLLIFWI